MHLDPELGARSCARARRRPRGSPVRVARDPAGRQGHLRYPRHADDTWVAVYPGHRPRADAASVAIARQHGRWCWESSYDRVRSLAPGPTTNPHDATRTPGDRVRTCRGGRGGHGAGRLCHPDDRLDRATGGVLRVVGYKPTHGLLPCVGVKAISETFDTVGVMTRTVEDAAFVVGSLSGRALALPPELSPPRLGICLTHEWRCCRRRDGGALRGAARGARERRSPSRRSDAPAVVRGARRGAEPGLDVRDRPLPGGRVPSLRGHDPGAAAQHRSRGSGDAAAMPTRSRSAWCETARRSSPPCSPRWTRSSPLRGRVRRPARVRRVTRSSTAPGRRSVPRLSASPPAPGRPGCRSAPDRGDASAGRTHAGLRSLGRGRGHVAAPDVRGQADVASGRS